MPLIGLAIGLLIGLIHRILRFIADWIGEARRRLARSYRSGYALVPEGSTPGDIVKTEPFVVARDPVALPYWDAPGEIARVADVSGVSASRRQRGWWWTATSAQVIEVLPYWVIFGPRGRLVDRVIHQTLHRWSDPASAALPGPDGRTVTLVLYGDEWRSAVAQQIKHGLEATSRSAAYDALRPKDGAELDEAQREALDTAFNRRIDDFRPAAKLALPAGIAAAFVDELDIDTTRRLSTDWERLVDWHGDEHIEPGQVIGVAHRLRSLVGFVDRHPTVAILITVSVLFPALFVWPIPATALYLALLVAAVAGALVRRLRTGRRGRRRRWRPKGDVDHASPSPAQLRWAMADAPGPATAIRSWNLQQLSDDALVWVALDGPAPEDPVRPLRWLSRSGQPAPVELRQAETGRFAFAFTDDHRHKRAKLAIPVRWTGRVALIALLEYVRATDGDGVIIDPGLEPSIVITPRPSESGEAVMDNGATND